MMTTKLIGVWLPWIMASALSNFLTAILHLINPRWSPLVLPNIFLLVIEVGFLILLFSILAFYARWSEIKDLKKVPSAEEEELTERQKMEKYAKAQGGAWAELTRVEVATQPFPRGTQ